MSNIVGLERFSAFVQVALSKHLAVAAVSTLLALHFARASTNDQSVQVSFLYPTNGMVFSAPYTGIVAVSVYSQGPTRMDLFMNGALQGTTSNSFFLLTPGNLAPGTYTFAAIASDSQGPIITNSLTFKVVNDVPPTVTLVSPTNNTVFFTATGIELQVQATASGGTIQRVEYYHQPLCGVAPIYPTICPPTYLGVSTISPFSLTLTNVAPGFYHLVAVAYDSSGVKTASDSIRIIVTDPVRLTSPSRNADGSFSFDVRFDPPVSAVNVLGSSDLLKWMLLPLSLPSGDAIIVKDADASMFDRRFYRTQLIFQELLPP
jgi:hypothetical protein